MKILLTGANGMLGKALQRELFDHDVIHHSRYVSDLSCMFQAEKFFDFVDAVKPEYIIHTAARVGGLLYNKENPYRFLMDNSIINNTVLEAAVSCAVPRFLGILSVCCYGDGFPENEYPLTEDKLFKLEPHPTNAAYAYSKRALAQSIIAANKQYGTRYNYLIPTNLYGECDTRGSKAHFCSMMVDKVIRTVKNNQKVVNFEGDGDALRQYMYVHDFAKIIRRHIELDIDDNYNVAPEDEMSAASMVNTLLIHSGHNDIEAKFANVMVKGQSKRTVSTAKFRQHHPNFNFTWFSDGIMKVYDRWLSTLN